MANAQAKGWGPPCSGPHLTLVRKDGLRLPVHAAILDLASILLDLTEMLRYDVDPKSTWGGLCRKIAGSDSWSFHAWWLAIDVNADRNPYASVEWHRRNARGTKPFGLQLVCDIPQAVIELWEAHGFEWGGRYKTKPDPMHFDFPGTPAQAQEFTRRVRAYLASHGGNTPPPPTGAPDMDADDKARAERIEAYVVGNQQGGLVDWADAGGDLNGYGVTAEGACLQVFFAAGTHHRRVLVPSGARRIFAGPRQLRTRTDLLVELTDGTIRWLTMDATRPGFPGQGELDPATTHLVPNAGGWHYVDIAPSAPA